MPSVSSDIDGFGEFCISKLQVALPEKFKLQNYYLTNSFIISTVNSGNSQSVQMQCTIHIVTLQVHVYIQGGVKKWTLYCVNIIYVNFIEL